MAVAIAVTVDVAVDATVDVDVDVVVCRVSCVVCRVSCVVCRVSCIVCRVWCIVCYVSNFVWRMRTMSFCSGSPPPFPPTTSILLIFSLKTRVCGPLFSLELSQNPLPSVVISTVRAWTFFWVPL